MLKISERMTGKLEGIDALNTDTTSNEFCKRMQKVKNTVCSQCYSMRMLKTFRKMCVPAFRHNSMMLGRELPDHALPYTTSKYFRMMAHGEVENMQQVENIMRIVQLNKQTFFAVWTKRKDLFGAWLARNKKPKNCNMVYSNPYIDMPCELPRGFDKVFNVSTADNEAVNCRGKCIECLLCYKRGGTTQVTEVLK